MKLISLKTWTSWSVFPYFDVHNHRHPQNHKVLDPDPSGYFQRAHYLNWCSSHVAKSAIVVIGDTKWPANQSFPFPLPFPSWPSYPRIKQLCQPFKYFAIKLRLCNSFLYHCGYPVATMVQKEGFCFYNCTFNWDKAWGLAWESRQRRELWKPETMPAKCTIRGTEIQFNWHLHCF